MNSLFSIYFLSQCIKLPIFTRPQRFKYLVFLPALPTKTDEYRPPLQSGRGCDLSSLVLPVFHSRQPMRSPHPVWGWWKMGEGRLPCSLWWHPYHFLIYNFTTEFFSPELEVNRQNNLETKIAPCKHLLPKPHSVCILERECVARKECPHMNTSHN